MFSVKIFTIHSWEYISWKWTCLIEIWITWLQKELAIPQLQIPLMKSQKELWKPDLILVSQGCQQEKKLHTQDSNPGPLHQFQAFCHWTIKARYIESPQSSWSQDPSWGNKSAKPVSDRQEWVLGSYEWNLYWFVAISHILLWWSSDKILNT